MQKSNSTVVHRGNCIVSGYDECDSDEEVYQPSPKHIPDMKNDEDLLDAIDEILSTMPVNSNSAKRIRGESGSNPSNMNAMMPSSSSEKSAMPISQREDEKSAFSFYSANPDDMDQIMSFKGRQHSVKDMEEIQKIQSRGSPSICPIEVSVDAWACAGFLPRIPETLECDYCRAPKCMSSRGPSRKASAGDEIPRGDSTELDSIEEEDDEPVSPSCRAPASAPIAPVKAVKEKSTSKSLSSVLQTDNWKSLRQSKALFVSACVLMLAAYSIQFSWN